jgi:Leucine-rich repeat (LRR) protein
MNDRYKLHQFYSGKQHEPKYLNVNEPCSEIYTTDALRINIAAKNLSPKSTRQKELESEWIKILPTLDNVKILTIRTRVSQLLFDTICEMQNLKRLYIWSSIAENIEKIKLLQNLKRLDISSFSRLVDISPLLSLKQLTTLSIENCFKIQNYEVLGGLVQLTGLSLSGNGFAPKNLRLNSLIPFEQLRHLKHLDLSAASVIDKSYDSILSMEQLERFDITINIAKPIRDKIKSQHKTLTAGFFTDWDFENKKFYEGKNWSIK